MVDRSSELHPPPNSKSEAEQRTTFPGAAYT